jgi:hypothetical protein
LGGFIFDLKNLSNQRLINIINSYPDIGDEVFATDAESAVVLRHEDALAVVMPLAAE